MQTKLDEVLKKGIVAYKTGYIGEAQRLYISVLKEQPRNPDANHNLGVLAVQVGKIKESLQFFKLALEGNPNIAQFWFSYIDAFVRLGWQRDAEELVDVAIKKRISGDILKKLQIQIEGIDGNQSKSSSDQDYWQDKIRLLIQTLNKGLYNESLADATQLLKNLPGSAPLYNICGVANARLGLFDEAILSYEKAIKIEPDYADAYNN